MDVMDLMNDIIKKHNTRERQEKQRQRITNSYGIAVLKTGFVVPIKYNYSILFSIWTEYIKIKNTSPNNIKEFLKTVNGGCFNSGDVQIDITEIQFLLNSEAYDRNNKGQKEFDKYKIEKMEDYLETMMLSSFFMASEIIPEEEEED